MINNTFFSPHRLCRFVIRAWRRPRCLSLSSSVKLIRTIFGIGWPNSSCLRTAIIGAPKATKLPCCLDDEINGVVGESFQGSLELGNLSGSDVFKNGLQLLQAAETNLQKERRNSFLVLEIVCEQQVQR